MNLGNVIRQQKKVVRESWLAYQELRRWAVIAEPYRSRTGLPFVCIDEDLERRCRMRLEPYFLARRVANVHKGAQVEAFNTWIKGGFGQGDSRDIYKGDGFELEMREF